MRVIRADVVEIDESTDLRQVLEENVDPQQLEWLADGITDGSVTVARGLTGWGSHNATLRDEFSEAAWHATVED